MKEVSTRIFDINTVKRPVTTGSLMVSQPFLRERYFKHAVVSVIDHSPGGNPMGVVLNNCTALTLNDLLEELSDTAPVPVYCGGPVGQDRLFFIHTLGPDIIAGATEYAPGLYVGGDMDAMTGYLRQGYPVQGTVRFFLGYSGWEPGQLEQEIDDEVWAVAPAKTGITPETLLTLHGDAMWHTVVRAMGRHYRLWNLHPASAGVN